jgi:hypothetical protein
MAPPDLVPALPILADSSPSSPPLLLRETREPVGGERERWTGFETVVEMLGTGMCFLMLYNGGGAGRSDVRRR